MANPPHSHDRKRSIFLYVRDRILSGVPPTTREVQQQFGFRAVQSARDYLEALVRDSNSKFGRVQVYRLSHSAAFDGSGAGIRHGGSK